MAVSPGEGVIPSKGQAALQIRYSPEQVARLDARVEVSLMSRKQRVFRPDCEELPSGFITDISEEHEVCGAQGGGNGGASKRRRERGEGPTWTKVSPRMHCGI